MGRALGLTGARTMNLERSGVLWLGRPASEEDRREIIQRGLLLMEASSIDDESARHARGAIVWAAEGYFERAYGLVEAGAKIAINHGLLLFIVVDSEPQRREIVRLLETTLRDAFTESACKIRLGKVPSYEGPHSTLIHTPGPAANPGLNIRAADLPEFGPDDRLVLQRAFHDCESVDLSPIKGGLSGANTYLAQATLADSRAGKTPMPYFVKLGNGKRLESELRSFKDYAERHISWHLRPNLDSAKCIFGSARGVVVGSLIPTSQSLWEAIVDGQAPSCIRSLFEETLGILRQQAVDCRPQESIVDNLEDTMRWRNVPSRIVRAAGAYGGEVLEPARLWRKLIALPHRLWRACAIHGDMHGENVRVRKGDAIVIDFANSTIGPVVADLASLDIWLSFRAPIAVGEVAWREHVTRAYERSRLLGTDQLAARDPALTQVAVALDEVRRQARRSATTDDEYLRVLAVYLVRHASFPPLPEIPFDGQRRAYAYWLANRLILELEAMNHNTRVAA